MSEIAKAAPYDFHVHTALSHDGSGSVLEYCERAVELQVREIGFCEHVDLDQHDPTFGLHDYERYRAEIEEARARYGARLTLRMGAEVGFVPRICAEIRDFLNEHRYDFVIGSVHAIADGRAGVSDEYEALETFARHSYLDAYYEYFELARELVVSGLFDVMGHLDLVRRFGAHHETGPVEWGNFYGTLRRLFEGMIKRQMALELNTSGLRQPPRSTYPGRDLIRLYHELGGQTVTLGSDAHEPAFLASGIPAALDLARDFRLRPVSFHERLPQTMAW
jgi:histidinol-phosphatase (PHP family)